MASVNLLESTSIHDFELVVSRDLVYKNYAWTGQASVLYQGSCIGFVGIHAKEPFLRETHLCCEGRFARYKDKEFSDEQFKRGVLGSIQITKINSTSYDEGVIGEVAEKNPELVKKFNEEYAKALKWVKENPEEAGKLAKEKLGMDAEVVKKSIPKMGLNFIHAQDAKKTLNEYYKIMKDYDPKTIGGKVPDENLYFNK